MMSMKSGQERSPQRQKLFEGAKTEANNAPIESVKWFGKWHNVQKVNGVNCFVVQFKGENVINPLADLFVSNEMAFEDIIAESGTCDFLQAYLNFLHE